MILAVPILLGAPAVPSGESDLAESQRKRQDHGDKVTHNTSPALVRSVARLFATTAEYGTGVFGYEVF
jgi:hypothetical protein